MQAPTQRHPDLRLHVSRNRDTGQRHIDDKAAAGSAIGEGQGRVRTCRDDARLFPAIEDAGVFLLLFEPGKFARELLAHGSGHVELEQKAAGNGVADDALQVTEIPEIGCDTVSDLADHRHRDHHSERRNAAGPASKGAWLALRVKPVRKRVMPACRDVDGSLFEKPLD